MLWATYVRFESVFPGAMGNICKILDFKGFCSRNAYEHSFNIILSGNGALFSILKKLLEKLVLFGPFPGPNLLKFEGNSLI